MPMKLDNDLIEAVMHHATVAIKTLAATATKRLDMSVENTDITVYTVGDNLIRIDIKQ